MSARTLRAIPVLAVALAMSAVSPPAAFAAPSSNPICSRLGRTIEASAGAQMFCFGPQLNGATGAGAALQPNASTASPFSANVNAASLSEDVSPSGARAYGQSETSVASTSSYVLEAWNDATSFFSPCPAPMSKEEGTGFGFSSNGGASFTDEGGLPNAACATHLTEGDPGVEAWQAGGSAYFYIMSLYPSISSSALQSDISLTACKVSGSGSAATISCGQPVVAAESTQCGHFFGPPVACSFLDKDYLSIDPSRGRLYVTYTEFGPTPETPSFNGQIELAACDIGTPSGGTGPAGGTAAHPVCEHGTPASASKLITSPYLTIAPGDPNCENEGAYPGADVKTGDVYVAYEFNAPTNIFALQCFGTPTKDTLNRVPASCLKLQSVSPCSGPAQTRSETITSLDAAFIPGYNRFPANDFPRIAVDPSASTVSMVWNDARSNPLGDILLRSYALGTLAPIQSAPVRINSGTSGLHFLPAVRNASAAGKISVSWYDRATPNTAVTDVRAALSLDPRLTGTPAANTLVTSTPTDWNNVSSDIVPNFGDYTDNYAAGGRLYIAWSDGRLGVPQPFEASTAMP
jgi:hypothetical protein